MKQLTINWQDVEMAFEDYPGELGYMLERANYFDLESGEVVFVDEQINSTVKEKSLLNYDSWRFTTSADKKPVKVTDHPA